MSFSVIKIQICGRMNVSDASAGAVEQVRPELLRTWVEKFLEMQKMTEVMENLLCSAARLLLSPSNSLFGDRDALLLSPSSSVSKDLFFLLLFFFCGAVALLSLVQDVMDLRSLDPNRVLEEDPPIPAHTLH